MKGKQITSIPDLIIAASEKRSVFEPSSMRRLSDLGAKPAAFVLNMNAVCVFRMIERGLFVYNAPNRSRYTKKEGEVA